VRHPAAWGEGEDRDGGGGIGEEEAGAAFASGLRIAMTAGLRGWGGGIRTRGRKTSVRDWTTEIVER
jgi:hypothetical protein